MEAWDDVVEHLARTTPLSPQIARRIVEEVVSFFAETPDAFVRRRHSELKALGMLNAEIFVRLRVEVAGRPFLAPPLTERQIRRLVYG